LTTGAPFVREGGKALEQELGEGGELEQASAASAPYSAGDSSAWVATGEKPTRSARSPRTRVRRTPPHVSSMFTAVPTALRLASSASAISAAVWSGGSQMHR